MSGLFNWIDCEKQSPPRDGKWFLIWDRKHMWRDRPPIVGVRFVENKSSPSDKDGVSYSNWNKWCHMPYSCEKDS